MQGAAQAFLYGVAADLLPGWVEKAQAVIGLGDKNAIAQVLNKGAVAVFAQLQVEIDLLLLGQVDIDAIQLKLVEAGAQHEVARVDPD